MRWSVATGALALGFALACTGSPTPPPAPVSRPAPPPAPAPAPEEPPLAVPADADPAAADTDGPTGDDVAAGGGEMTGDEGGGDGEFWCCEYDGPSGRTQALLDAPKACTDQYGAKGGAFVKGPQCEPVCCVTAKVAGDPSKGTNAAFAATAACTASEGTVDAGACATAAPRPRPRPAPNVRLTRPGSTPAPGAPRPAPSNDGNRKTRPQ